MQQQEVTVVGGGLAGSEAAWQIARRGVRVRLYEMRPGRATAVHRTGDMAELVCSNSLKSMALTSAHGLLKEEMQRLGSVILECAREHRVPAGQALAVDREAFSAAVTGALEAEELITIVREEVTEIPESGIVILAVGPLVSDSLAGAIAAFTGVDYLYFFDAIAPVVLAESIDRSLVFAASRYGKGEGDDYLNCPMSGEEYDRFLSELLAGEMAPLHEFDATPFFEGCLARYVALRADEARGVDRSSYRGACARRRSAAAGQSCCRALFDGGVSDAAALAGAEAGLSVDSRARVGGVRAAWTGASELLHQCADRSRV
jgi:methylenetetrahydrofolate--tRNA-(uracil-5-)-methyltransferase